MSECIISNKDLLRHWLMDIEHVLLASEWIMREIAVSEEELAEEINLIAEIRSKIFSRRVRIS